MPALEGVGFQLGFRPKLQLLAALRNHFIHISLGVHPVTASCGQRKDLAERSFGIIEAAALQFRRALSPKRVLPARRAVHLCGIRLLAELPAQVGAERSWRT